MTRAEVIREIAIRGEIPQLEASRFMELFLLKLASLLVEGDSLNFAGLGDFTLIKISSAQAAVQQLSNAIKFVPEQASSSQSELIFGIPTNSHETVSDLDLYFNLGINKPLIPLKGNVAVTDDVPTSPLEIRKYFEQKVDHILTGGVIERASSYNTSSWDTLYDESPNQKPQIEAEDGLDVPWEFGGDWKKEYEEESILASTGDFHDGGYKAPTDKPEPKEETEAGWDFGQLDSQETQHDEKNFFTQDEETPSPVTGLTRELEIDLSEFEGDKIHETSETDALEDFDSIFKKSLAQNMFEQTPEDIEEQYKKEQYQRVRSTSEILNLPSFLEEETEEVMDDGPANPAIDLRGNKLSRQFNDERFSPKGITHSYIPATLQKAYTSSKWYVLAFIIVTVIASLLYSKLYTPPAKIKQAPVATVTPVKVEQDIVVRKIIPTVIERDYSFPVTYPYAAAEPKNVAPLTGKQGKPEPATTVPHNDVKPVPKEVKKETEQPAAQVVQKKEQPVMPQASQKKVVTGKDVSRNVAGNIYQEGNSFQIQVMSIKDQSKAEQEVSRLKGMGIQATVREVEIPKRGLWYRVRIGGFNTIQEAEQFARKIR